MLDEAGETRLTCDVPLIPCEKIFITKGITMKMQLL